MTYAAFGIPVMTNVDLGSSPGKSLFPAVTLRHRRVSSLGSRLFKPAPYLAQSRTIHPELRRQVHVQIKIDDLLQFSLLLKRNLILCTSVPSASLNHIRYWFLQKILPLYLVLREAVVILHAGAVEVEGKAAAFLAPSGTGKPTLVNHFVGRGHSLITDEHLVIGKDAALALPAIPYHRPYRRVECLGEHTVAFSGSPVPMQRFYILEKGAPEDEVAIETLTGGAAAIALCMRQQFDLSGLAHSPTYRHVQASRFARITDLLSEVPVKRIRVPRRLDRLPEVYAAIRSDIQQCNTSSVQMKRGVSIEV